MGRRCWPRGLGRRAVALAEALEPRRLLSAAQPNLHVTDAYLVDQNLNPDPNPTVGYPVYA